MQVKSDLVVFGAGGFAREVAQLARDAAADGAPLRLIGFLTDDASAHGSEVGGLPVLGGRSYLKRHSGLLDVVLGVGAPAVKWQIMRHIEGSARGFPSLVHPTVVRSSRVEIGRGAVICAMTAITTDVRIQEFAAVNLACTIGHDVVVSDYATIAPGVNVSGSVLIGTGCDIGTGASVIQGRQLGNWSIIGAGAVVTSDIPADCTAVGVPARPVKQRAAGWHLTSSE